MMKKTWKVWLAVLTMMSLSVAGIGCGSEEKKEDTNVSSEKEADTKTEDVAEDETDAEADGDAEVEGDTENEVDTEMELDLPWENGGKQPEEYTWEEFEALEGGLQIAFQNSFADIDAFDEWMQSVRGEDTVSEADTEAEVELPWEDGGKQPEEYTWEEFEALEGGQQMAFQNSFENIDEFDAWMQSVRGEDTVNEADTEAEVELPWENGGKQPEEYSWEEFEALEGGQQIAFQNSFENIDAFDVWLQNARGEDTEVEPELPWKNGGKQPEEYSWEEFEALEGGQQIVFQNSFENIDAFDEWLQKVNPQ